MTAVRRHSQNASQGAAAPSAQLRAERDQLLGETLLRLGRLNDEAMQRIADLQQRTNAPFAKAASSLGLITRDDVETAIGVQRGFVREGDGEGRLPANAVIVRRPRSKEAEQFRALRTKLLTSKDADKLSMFAIAAMGSNGEADHATLNLAASFAQIGKRVLIVDADLRASRLSACFGAPEGPGLHETLAGACDVGTSVRATVIANLSVLTAGAAHVNAHERLADKTLPQTLDHLRRSFDIVIVMTSPFGKVADARFVWSAVGAVLVVARRHHDRLSELTELNAALRQVDAAIIGAALLG